MTSKRDLSERIEGLARGLDALRKDLNYHVLSHREADNAKRRAAYAAKKAQKK